LIWDLRPVPKAAYDTTRHLSHQPVAAKAAVSAADTAATEEAAAVRSLPVKP
jgi:hypothetical protein